MTSGYRLPWVVAPYPGEWLGYWLLRVAGVYGLPTRELLRLAGVPGVRFVEPTWARLGDRPLLDWRGMSRLLGEPMRRLKRMHALTSTPSRLAQLACCTSCLRRDLRGVGTPYWRRAWMDPYVAVCGRHRRPLRPVDARVVRSLVGLNQSTQLLIRLAGDDAIAVAPRMALGEVQDLIRLQARLKPDCSRVLTPDTRRFMLRHHVDAIASALHGSGEAGSVVSVNVPRFAGWLAGVRDLQARQTLLRGVVRHLAAADSDTAV